MVFIIDVFIDPRGSDYKIINLIKLSFMFVLQIPSIFTLNYVPWGNAVIKGGSFDCQHGTMECTINTIDACVIHYYPNQYVLGGGGGGGRGDGLRKGTALYSILVPDQKLQRM